MWYLIAFAGGCILAGVVPWVWRRVFHGKQLGASLGAYDPDKAEKKKERIIKHAEDERNKVKEEADKARSTIDDF
jgi:hypothetical protein